MRLCRCVGMCVVRASLLCRSLVMPAVHSLCWLVVLSSVCVVLLFQCFVSLLCCYIVIVLCSSCARLLYLAVNLFLCRVVPSLFVSFGIMCLFVLIGCGVVVLFCNDVVMSCCQCVMLLCCLCCCVAML